MKEFANKASEIKKEESNLPAHEFYMFFYKTSLCNRSKEHHDPQKCIHAHSMSDFRYKK